MGTILPFPGTGNSLVSQETFRGTPDHNELYTLQHNIVPMAEDLNLEAVDIKELLRSPEGAQQLQNWFDQNWMAYLTSPDDLTAAKYLANLELTKHKLKSFWWRELKKLAVWIGLSAVLLLPQTREQIADMIEDVSMSFIDKEQIAEIEGYDQLLEEWSNADKSLSWDMSRNGNIIAGTLLAPFMQLSSTANKVTMFPQFALASMISGILTALVSISATFIPAVTGIKASLALWKYASLKMSFAKQKEAFNDLKQQAMTNNIMPAFQVGIQKLNPAELSEMLKSRQLNIELILEASNRGNFDAVQYDQFSDPRTMVIEGNYQRVA